MTRIITLLLTLFILCGCGKESNKSTPGSIETQEYIIVGYATYWDTVIPDPTLLTHINYSFAKIKSDFESLDIRTPSRLEEIVALKQIKPDLKVLLAIGGWGAGNFSEMAADENHRKKFCENCLEAINQYGLDGIDLDWEYPTSSSAGISSSPDDTNNFTLLLADLRATLGADYLISMASAARAKYVDFKNAIKYLDHVNIMSYDMGKPPKHNSALYASSLASLSCDDAVRLHRQAGVPYNKMTLGMPFYGHGNGTDFKADVDFNEINTEGYSQMWDARAKVPYLVNKSGVMVLTYDDEKSIGFKADYIKSMGLRGAMYWSIEGDDSNWTLSKTIANHRLGIDDKS